MDAQGMMFEWERSRLLCCSIDNITLKQQNYVNIIKMLKLLDIDSHSTPKTFSQYLAIASIFLVLAYTRKEIK